MPFNASKWLWKVLVLIFQLDLSLKWPCKLIPLTFFSPKKYQDRWQIIWWSNPDKRIMWNLELEYVHIVVEFLLHRRSMRMVVPLKCWQTIIVVAHMEVYDNMPILVANKGITLNFFYGLVCRTYMYHQFTNDTLQGEHLVVEVFTEPPWQIDPFYVNCRGW